MYYTPLEASTPLQPLSSWKSKFVDNYPLTTITDLKKDTMYTIRVEAYTAIGSCGPPSLPFLVKTQVGVPGQPTNIRVIDQQATSLMLEWSPPILSSDNIIAYELYWNDTFSNRVLLLLSITTFIDYLIVDLDSLIQRNLNRRTLNVTTSYRLDNLNPNTLYFIWLSARSSKGEGAHTTPIEATTDRYGKSITIRI